MYYVSSGTNNNQNNQQQQDFIIDQNDTLNAINEYLKPSNGQHDRFQCIKHEGSIKIGQNIKSCLKYALDNNDQLNIAEIADRLNKEYNHSCIVYEDSNKNINFDAGGIKSRMSKWLIQNQRREIVARCHILIIYKQKDNMRTADDEKNQNPNYIIKTINQHNKASMGQHYVECIGHCGSMESAQNMQSCLQQLLDNYQINAPLVAGMLEKLYKYSCIVWEGDDLKKVIPIAAAIGIKFKGLSGWVIKDTAGTVVTRFAILIIFRHIKSID